VEVKEDLVTLAAALMACWPTEMSKVLAIRAIKAGEVARIQEGCEASVVERHPGKRHVASTDRIVWKGVVRTLPAPLWVALNKPAGYTTTTVEGAANDEGQSVYEVLTHPNKNLRAVGRLDKATEGLLLFTTQGRWAWQLRLGAGAAAVGKRYRCWLKHPASSANLTTLLDGGLQFRDKKVEGGFATAKPALAAAFVEGDASCVDVTIAEGRNRQVRRMWNVLDDNHVLRLLRLDFGPVALGALAVGTFRELTPTEVDALQTLLTTGVA